MIFSRLQPPALPPVTRAEAKAHLRVSHDNEDELIDSLIAAAAAHIGEDAGLSLITETWRTYFDACDGPCFTIGKRPVQRVEAVTVYNHDGLPTVLDGEDYQLLANKFPAELRIDRDVLGENAANGVEIDFVSGFGLTGADVPDTLKRAVLVLVAYWYEFRGAFDASDQPVSIPVQYSNLIRPYKARRL